MTDPTPYRDFTIFKSDRPADGVLRLWLDTGVPNNGVTHENHPEFGASGAPSPTRTMSAPCSSAAPGASSAAGAT